VGSSISLQNQAAAHQQFAAQHQSSSGTYLSGEMSGQPASDLYGTKYMSPTLKTMGQRQPLNDTMTNLQQRQQSTDTIKQREPSNEGMSGMQFGNDVYQGFERRESFNQNHDLIQSSFGANSGHMN